MEKKYWFEREKGSFMMTDPYTGKAWENQLWNKTGFHAAITQTGTGFSRYVNDDSINVFLISGGRRFVYLRDEDNGNYWNIGVGPTLEPVEEYTCEHSLEYTKISSKKDGIRSSWTITLPEEGTYEAWKVQVKNESAKKRRLSLFSCIGFELSGYPQPFYYNPSTTTAALYKKELNGIFCVSKNPFQPHDRCSGFLVSSQKVDYYDAWMEKFFGTLGSPAKPETLLNRANCSNTEITVRDRGAVLQSVIEIAAGEEITVYTIAGLTGDEKTAAVETKAALASAPSVFEGIVERGRRRFGGLSAVTPDERVNNIMNYWVEKQVSYCMIGKKAVRDNAQLAMAMLNYDLELAEICTTECLAHQYEDGHAHLTWSPVMDPHVYSDPPMWLIFLVCEYIKETGDTEFLKKVVPYFDNGSDTVYDHLKKAEKWLTDNVGPHGLTRIRYADWNDALNIPDENAESVFMAMGVSWALNELADLADELGDDDYKAVLRKRSKTLVDKTNEIAWNGDYYVRAISKFGNVGDKDSKIGGNIYINPQSWAILGGVVPKERLEKLCRAIDSMDTPYGIPICKPSYSEYDETVGRMSGMLPGVYENGGIYHHACGFKIMADCKIGRKEQALASLLKMIPDGPDTPSSKTTTEPYVFTNCYLMNPAARLLVGSAWQTGTSSWALRDFYEGILGMIRTYKGLRIHPAISDKWNKAEADRTFRGCRYHLAYINKKAGTVSLKVDGKKIDGDILPVYSDGKVHQVTVEF